MQHMRNGFLLGICFGVSPGQKTDSLPSAGGQNDGVGDHLQCSKGQIEEDLQRLEGILQAERPGVGRRLPLQTGRYEH